MGVRVKDEGQFKEIYVKALDSLPVGTIVDYDGQASDIPAGWETYGTGQIKKTSETRPLASHTVNAYSESESNAYSCDYSNKAFGGVVLYNNASGSNANITLSDSAGNYDYIEIFFKSIDNIYSSVKGINGTIIMCHIVSTITNTQYWYNPVLTTYSINGTSLSISNKVSYNITNNWTKTDSRNTQNNIYITKVIGYKTGLFPTQQSNRSVNTYSGDIEEKKDIVIDDGNK